jgi:hypothetical protein
MARTRTLGQILSTIRVRADIKNATDRWPDADLIDRVNQSYSDLWDEILKAHGHEPYLQTFDLQTVANTSTYALAPDFYQMHSVKWVLGAELVELEPFELHEMVGQYTLVWPYGPRPRWRAIGLDPVTNVAQVMFDPIPTASNNRIRTFYVPHAPIFDTAGGDNSKPINGFNGYENYVVWDVAAQILEEEDRDSTTFLRRREESRQKVMGTAPHRNSAGPEFINRGHGWRRTYAQGTW